MQPHYNQPQGLQVPLRQGPPSNQYPHLSPYAANTQQPSGYPQLDQQPTTYSNQPVRYLPPNQYGNNNLNAEETPLLAKRRELKQEIAEIDKKFDSGCYKLIYIWNWICVIILSIIGIASLIMGLPLLGRWKYLTGPQLVFIGVCIMILFQHIAEIVALTKKKFGWALTTMIIMSVMTVVYIYAEIITYNQYIVDIAKPYRSFEKDTYDSMVNGDRLFLTVIGVAIGIHVLINLPSSFLICRNLKKKSSLELQLSLEDSN